MAKSRVPLPGYEMSRKIFFEALHGRIVHEAPRRAGTARLRIQQHFRAAVIGLVEAVRAVERYWNRKDVRSPTKRCGNSLRRRISAGFHGNDLGAVLLE